MHTLIDSLLIAATSAYAHWLMEHKELEPDLTFVEVGLGVALCLIAAGAHSRLAGGDWRANERAVWRAFAIGSPPIVVGELVQWRRRHVARQRLAARWD
jgi:hypothetical protein